MTTTTMTAEDVAEFARRHIAANPDATSQDVKDAIRASGYVHLLHFHQVHAACEAIRPMPTLATSDDAAGFMARLAQRYDDVAVFWDRGWGDSGQVAEITVIVNGDGQMPLARLTPDVYRDLLRLRVIAPNSLITYKARKVHQFSADAGGRGEGC